ncbi:MAG: cytochrome ubiquinol oxidase subunit I [Veillonella sp.]|uniref:cytochrome ubiquinol oxidase subunit I n=1 Tax=Veillonella sp. TaxID=1926307 RepID=UPI0025E95861|nr:cytochrome ubiquinol oxidase subunit I [Veillonella sp.]MBS4914151.1 cytochrome ubiquinol oxidase subunit I [Veillonella sp.]
MMDAIMLARLQFALTSIYHWLFVPVTLGMTVAVACMEIAYVSTKNETYKKMAKFWGKLFLINFAMGVVTGIVQEFHFGMNWSEYSRFMGDIFGAPLALEALTAFFLESTFMGAWIFGWDRLSAKAHATVAVLVAIGTNLSAFWILVASSFMQNPVGFVIRNGRAEMESFGAILSNGYVPGQFGHIFTDGLMTAGVIIASISAWHILRNNALDFYKRSMQWGLVFTIIGGILVSGVGHLHGQYVTKVQPMKIASVEGLWDTTQGASFSMFATIDEKNQTTNSFIELPKVLSFVATDDFNGTVQGMKDLQKADEAKYGPGDYVPHVTSMYWTFRAMVFSGALMLLVAIVSFAMHRSGKLETSRGMLKLLFWMLPFAYIANASGWYVAEMGRQPWLVYGLQKTAAGVSPTVTASEILTTIIGFTAVYVLAAIAALYLAVKHIKKGPEGNPSHDVREEAALWK